MKMKATLNVQWRMSMTRMSAIHVQQTKKVISGGACIQKRQKGNDQLSLFLHGLILKFNCNTLKVRTWNNSQEIRDNKGTIGVQNASQFKAINGGGESRDPL